MQEGSLVEPEGPEFSGPHYRPPRSLSVCERIGEKGRESRVLLPVKLIGDGGFV